MKKIISIILIIVLVFSFAGCGEKEKAETAVAKMLDAFKAQKYDTAQKYINGGNVKDYGPIYDLIGKDGTIFMDCLFDNLEYKIVSSEKVDKNTVNVTTEIVAIDALPVLAEFFLVLSEASAAEPDLWQDEEYIFSEIDAIFEKVATQSGLATVTNKVTIKAQKDGENWKIIPDEPFVNALYGCLVEAAAEIAEANKMLEE